MADFVHHVLEDMVPELEDLERRGYFNKHEIKQIVQKRQDFEYNLRRRAPVKSDFQRYIDYESSLERLRQLRRKQRNITGKDTLADHCINRRIHFIYDRMLRKFKGDLTLWSQWIHFCKKSKSSRQMSRVLTRALQLHPTCPALWTTAAAWEFDANGNANAARALMQRGLRMCKDSPALWHEYFRMELLYAARLGARREILLGTDPLDSTDHAAQKHATEEDAATLAVLKGSVAKVVYTNAIAAVADSSIEFRKGFLDVLESISLPGKDELEHYILDEIRKDFENSAGYVGLRASCIMNKASSGAGSSSRKTDRDVVSAVHDALIKALNVFDAAVSSQTAAGHGNDEMKELWMAAVTFIEEHLQSILDVLDCSRVDSEGNNEDGEALLVHNAYSSMAALLLSKAVEYITTAMDAQQANEYLYIVLPKMYLRLGQIEKAIAAATDIATDAVAVVDKTPSLIRHSLQMHCLSTALTTITSTALSTSYSSCEDLVSFIKNPQNMNAMNQPDVWLVAVRTAIAYGWSLQPLCALLIERQLGSSKGELHGGMGKAAACLYNAVHEIDGPAAARKLCSSLLAYPLPGGSFIHAVLDAELAHYESIVETASKGHARDVASTGDNAKKEIKAALKSIVRIFEAGVTAYGSFDVDLWLRYLQFEQTTKSALLLKMVGSVGVITGDVHWRAVKALNDSDSFVARAQYLTTR